MCKLFHQQIKNIGILFLKIKEVYYRVDYDVYFPFNKKEIINFSTLLIKFGKGLKIKS